MVKPSKERKKAYSRTGSVCRAMPIESRSEVSAVRTVVRFFMRRGRKVSRTLCRKVIVHLESSPPLKGKGGRLPRPPRVSRPVLELHVDGHGLDDAVSGTGHVHDDLVGVP